MKAYILSILCAAFSFISVAQHRWDGGGGDGRWDNAANWQPDGVPLPGSGVLLDNSLDVFGYTVTLPPGAVTVELAFLQVIPGSGQSIELILPRENTASPGLRITGPGDALALETGALLRNASGASAGDAIQVTGTFRIANGARYLHQTARGNATLIDRLSVAEGTETGIFEFDVPGTAGYTVSLTGNTFGTLAFSASAAGGVKAYSGSGSSILQIRGDWIIRKGATLTSTLSANVQLQGTLDVEGSLQLNPSTAGTTGRSVLFAGASGRIRGEGHIGFNAQFRTLEFTPGATYHLNRNLSLPFPQHRVLVRPGAVVHLETNEIQGDGRFTIEPGGTLGIGNPEGISFSGSAGNIRTALREFSEGAWYLYEGEGYQLTGSGLPVRVARLLVNKPSGNLQLSQNVSITNLLGLYEGIIASSASGMITLAGAGIESPVNAYGSSNQGWEGSFVDGPVGWESSQAMTMVLPTGRGDVFAPVSIRHSGSASSTYTATYHPVPFGNTEPVLAPLLSNISRLEYWAITSTSAGVDANARIALSWRPASGVGTTPEAWSDLRIAQYEDRGTGLRWEPMGVNPAVTENAGYGWIESDQPGSSFSAITLASASRLNVLPISQLHLQVESRNGTAYIRCRAEGSGQCPELILEHSTDGRDFEAISGIKTGLEFGREYEWPDSFPARGWNYYRVRAPDPAKKFSSGNVRLWLDKIDSYKLYPNPARDRFILNFPSPGSGSAALLVQPDGKVLRQITLSGHSHQEDISNLPAGRYFLMIKHHRDWRIIPFLKY
jgi:hypothetical protein